MAHFQLGEFRGWLKTRLLGAEVGVPMTDSIVEEVNERLQALVIEHRILLSRMIEIRDYECVFEKCSVVADKALLEAGYPAKWPQEHKLQEDWQHSLSEAERPANINEQGMLDDGFGNRWPRECPICHRATMQIVRPGKVQCVNCG